MKRWHEAEEVMDVKPFDWQPAKAIWLYSLSAQTAENIALRRRPLPEKIAAYAVKTNVNTNSQ